MERRSPATLGCHDAVFIAFTEAMVSALTTSALDPFGKIAAFELCAEAVSAASRR